MYKNYNFLAGILRENPLPPPNYSSGGKRTNSYLVILFCFIIQGDDVNGQQNRIVLINGGPGSGMMSTKYSTDSLVNLYDSIVIEKSCA